MAAALAQAAKAILAYAEEEKSIKIKRARLEATLDVLPLWKEADAIIAKAEVTEAAAQFDIVNRSNELDIFNPPQSKK